MCSDIMDTWTRQMGFPVLQLERQLDGSRYRIRQQRFLLNPDEEEGNAIIPAAEGNAIAADETPSPFGYKWDVPVTWISSGNQVIFVSNFF